MHLSKEYQEEFYQKIIYENALRARGIAFLGMLFGLMLAILSFIRFQSGSIDNAYAIGLLCCHVVLLSCIVPFLWLNANYEKIKAYQYKHAKYWIYITLIIIASSLIPMNLIGIPYRTTIIPFASFIIVFNLIFTFSKQNTIVVNVICLLITGTAIIFFKSDDIVGLSAMLIEIIAMSAMPLYFALIKYDKAEKDFLKEKLLLKKNKQIEIANNELKNFAYVASHDLKEPLRMVNSYLGLLKRDLGDNISPKQEEFIHYAVDGAKRMKSLMEDLLDYANIGHIKISENKISLEDILLIVIQNLKVRIETINAFVETSPLPEVRGNTNRLIQLFQNLIGNAIKFRDEEREIKIRIHYKKYPLYHEVSIQDNGIGIPENAQVEIFNLFQRVHKYKRDGSGIGLATCKKIMEQLGGSILLKSEEGVGSTFFLHFPISSKNIETPFEENIFKERV